jgi:hypothetical protein
MRLAFCILLLAIVPVDRLVALGMFMVIGAIYIRHHKDDLDNIIVIKNPMASNYTKAPKAMTELDQGGQADESYDEMDFTSKDDDQTNEFHKVSSSIDEKHALQTEGLGSKSQSLFPEDSHKAAELMKGNSDGSQD